MNHERLYEFRFRDTDQSRRREVWTAIAPFIHRRMGGPERVLDPAAGRGEFISSVPAGERWAVDRTAYPDAELDPEVELLIADVMEAELPEAHFDGVFVSNFLEHLPTPEHVASFLERMHGLTRRGGRIAVMGPNYRYCARVYWDCADHCLALTHVAVGEHLYAAGFAPTESIPRFLPYSFRGRLPASRALAAAYLGFRPAWRLLGKQFLVLAEKRG